MSLDPLKLVFIVSGTLVLFGVALKTTRRTTQRLILFGLLGGLFFYSGIGAADESVAPEFMVFYFVTFIAILGGFHFGWPLFSTAGVATGWHLTPAIGQMTRGKKWLLLIGGYLLVFLFPLVWPELRLDQLLAPPTANLRGAFFDRFREEPDVILRVVGYLEVVLTPFFYIALFRLRARIGWILIVLLSLFYVEYVRSAYIGRSVIVINLGVLALAMWYLRPQYRRVLAIVGAALVPLLLYGAYWYGRIRIGGNVEGVGVVHAMYEVLATEWSLVRDVGMPVWESGERVDLVSYGTWIATLPIPKIFTGPIEGARINYEISEIVLGSRVGSSGWYVVLPGFTAESVYLYGEALVWINGLVVGFVASLFARVAQRVPQVLFLYMYIVVVFAYVLNRGGIGALLPRIINELLLLYVFVFYVIYRGEQRRWRWGKREQSGAGNGGESRLV